MKEEELWEQFFASKEKRDSREERRRLQNKDRSQFKKTDLEKVKAEVLVGERGRVIEIGPSQIRVMTESGLVETGLKGTLKSKNQKLKNLIAVGDFVRLNETRSVITAVEPRVSWLARSENLDRQKQQLIAANIDQVIITLSVCEPAFSAPLVDRYLIAAEVGALHPIIVINKIDKEFEGPKAYQKMMQALGYEVILTSVKNETGIEELEAAMAAKTSVFSGPSGAGKSSLINRVIGTELKTGETSAFSGKGRHTTTSTRLVPTKGGGFCLDTPGVRSFGIWELSFENITEHFFEIAEVGRECRYTNCRHINEPGCAVCAALSKEPESDIRVFETRYQSYRALIDELEEKHKRR